MQKKRKVKHTPSPEQRDDIRTGLSVEVIKRSVLDNLYFHLAKVPLTATQNDWYLALAYTVRDRMIQRWIKTLQNFTEDLTVIAYLSSEFLMGPQLGINLITLGIYDKVFQAVKELGLNLHELTDQEKEPGLGNSGMGRLAACYRDYLATSRIPTMGYGIRYEFGAFEQEIRDGWQIAKTDKWLRPGNPWEIPRPDITYHVSLGGRTETFLVGQGRFRGRG